LGVPDKGEFAIDIKKLFHDGGKKLDRSNLGGEDSVWSCRK
jgi:hypothetical protein